MPAKKGQENNIGFRRVTTAKRVEGRFTSPYGEPKGKPRAIRLPLSLDQWLEEEMERRNCSRNDLVEEAIKLFQASQESIA